MSRAEVGPTGERGSVRERLLASADELFYSEGIKAVGIERILEHAGVAKASLYSTFGSKEALVAAYLDGRRELAQRTVAHAIGGQSTPREQILAVFDAQAELGARPGFRGCAFVKASVEARSAGCVKQATNDYRRYMRHVFTQLAGDGGADDPAALACQLLSLYDGAAVASQLDHLPDAAEHTRAAAASLVDAALGRTGGVAALHGNAN